MTTTYSVTTDLNDYAPGATAYISASGFQAGSAVTFRVQHVSGPGADGVYGTLDDEVVVLSGAGHDPWTIIDGGSGDADGLANGSIQTSWYVNPDDSLDETFLLTASGNGWITSNTFTDGKKLGEAVAASPTEANFAKFIDYQVPDSTGTGVINSFLRMQDNNISPGFEAGYNTDGRPVQFNEDTSAQNNFGIRYIEVPKVTIEGVTYLVLNLDLNESNANDPNADLITLQNIKIFTASTGNLTNMDASTRLFPTATLRYELDIDTNHDGDALDAGETDNFTDLTDWNKGSGTGDYQVLIPVAGDSNNLGFAGVQPSAYFYIYSEFGTKNGTGYLADGGFEEWFVVKSSSMTIDKTATVNGGNLVTAVGDVIHYNIVVTNTGSEALTSVTVSDPYVTDMTYVSGDLNTNNVLDVLEVWTYSASHTVTAAEFYSLGGGDGHLENTATADSAETDPVSDSAIVDIQEVRSLAIDKTGTVPGGTANVAGETITYTYVVTNTGNAAIANVVVRDDNATPGNTGDDFNATYVSGDTDSDGLLDVTESWNYTSTRNVTQDMLDAGADLTNLATATGSGATPDTDDATIDVEQRPDIEINKITIYGSNSGDGLTGVIAGNAITWQYAVSNTGNTALSDVDVSDDNGTPGDTTDDFNPSYVSGDTDSDGKLDVTETWIFEEMGTAVVGTYQNLGTATGTAGGIKVDDSDASSYTATAPGALIAPTGTTPLQYINGTAMTFQDYYAYQGGDIQYGVKSGKINQTNPGVFFYFTGASGDIKDGDNDNVIDTIQIKVDQARTVSSINPFYPLNNSNIQLYKVIDNGDSTVGVGDSLVAVKPATTISINKNALSSDFGDLTVSFKPEAEGTMYVLSVKYSTASAVGATVGTSPGAWPTSHYDFSTYVNSVFSETYAAGVDLAPKPVSPMMLDGEEGDGAMAIRASQARAAYKAALSWWSEQGFDVSSLKKPMVQVADLGEQDGQWLLGMTQDGVITIDDDAANHGWSLGKGKVVADKVDLMSVMVHEVGHLLGMSHEDMGESLEVGVRSLPTMDEASDDQVGLVGTQMQQGEILFG